MTTKKAVALVALALSAFSAHAQAPRTIDFTQVIKAVDGKPILTPKGEPGPDAGAPLTLGDVAVNALENVSQEDQKLSGEEKFKMDILARKIYKAKAAKLTLEEVTLIKNRIGRLYGPMVVGAAWHELDPNQ